MAEEEKKEETTKLDDDVQKNVDAYNKGKDFIGSTHKEVNSFVGQNVIDGFYKTIPPCAFHAAAGMP